MADRQTMNVSLPSSQERFVRAQVDAGRYRSASEVVRDGLRLLEEAEHERLLEKWLYEGLSPDEDSQLPPELLERARVHIQRLVADGIRDRDANRVTDGPTAMDRIRQRLHARNKSA